jgi:hypothetical protein
VRRGQQPLVRDLALGVYAWTFGHALDWGRGGPKAWPAVRPYSGATGAEDQRGFRIFDWYEQICAETLGRALPMIALAAGIGLTWNPESEEDCATVTAMAQAATAGGLPESVIALNLHLLCAEPGSTEFGAALYADASAPRAAARALFTAAAREPASPAAASPKTMGHYLLLPTNGSVGREAWNALAEYVLVWRPVIGFSASEASLASEVTLVGDARALPVSLENELRAAGCVVRRVLPEKPQAQRASAPATLPDPQPSLTYGVSHG